MKLLSRAHHALRDKPLNPVLSFTDISFLTFEAVMQAVIICAAGFFVARSGLLTVPGQKVISMLNVDLFTPCLVFTKLASSLSINKLDDILVIPIFYAISTFISYICARGTSRVLHLNSPETDFVTAMSVFGNSNSLPVSLTMSLAYTLPDLLWDQIEDDDSDKVASRGILYLLIFQQLGQILRWSWGYNTLLRKRSQEELSTYDNTAQIAQQEGVRLLNEDALYMDSPAAAAAAAAAAPTEASTDAPPAVTSQEQDQQSSSSEEGEIQTKAKSTNAFVGWIKHVLHVVACWRPVRAFLNFMNPPLYAMAISIFIASVPALQKEFFEKGTFINNTLTQSIKQLGSVSIPLILIVMGSNLYPSRDVPPPSRNYKKIIVASLLSRMILPSFLLLPIIAVCVKYINVSILDDPIFLIVAFILTISPPAIQLTQITQLNNIYQKEMAGVLFWGYVVLTLPTTIVIVVTSLEVLEWAI